MATVTKDTTRIDSQIKALEAKELYIERQLLQGAISQEEAQKKRSELASQLAEAEREKSQLLSTETDSGSNEGKKNETAHATPHVSSGLANTSESNPKDATNTDDSETAETTNALLKLRNKTQYSFINASKKTVKAPINTYSWVYKYTPLGFIYGKLSPRIKEREYAQKATRQLQAASQKMKGVPKIAAKKGAHWYMKYTPLGFALRKINNKLPEKYKDPHQKIASKIKERRSVTEYEKAWNDAVLKRTVSQRLRNSEKISKLLRSKGWKVGKYFLPVAGGIFAAKSAKNVMVHRNAKKHADEWWSAYENFYQKQPDSKPQNQNSAQLDSRTKNLAKNAGKLTWKGYSKAYSYTPIGQAWKRLEQPRESINRKLGNRFGNGAEKKAGRKAAQKMGGKFAKTIGKQAVLTFLKTPPGWVTLGVLGAIFLFIVLLMTIVTLIGGGGGGRSGGNTLPPVVGAPGGGSTPPTIPGFTLSKTVDKQQISFPEEITYTLSFSYSSQGTIQLSDITVHDPLPQNTELVSASGNYIYNTTTRTVSWKLSDPVNTSPFILVIKPTIDNQAVRNTAYAIAIRPSDGALVPSGNIDSLLRNASTYANVPYPLLKAVANVESSLIDSKIYDDQTVEILNTTNWFVGLEDNAPTKEENHPLIIKGLAYNTCKYLAGTPYACGRPTDDVRGVMQFLLSTWDNIKPRIPRINNREPDRRYVQENIYGAALEVRRIIDANDDTYRFTSNLDNLTRDQVIAVSRSYCGGSSDTGGCATHRDRMWDYYQQYREEENR